MSQHAYHKMRICIVSDPDIVQKTLQSFLTDLGHDVISVTVSELREYLEHHTKPIHLAIIPQHIEKPLLQEFHHKHPETMIALLNGSRCLLSTDEALDYGVYTFLHTPIHFNELEVLLIRLAQYYTHKGDSRRLPFDV
jgi:DNA-binding NtrC family response regulator